MKLLLWSFFMVACFIAAQRKSNGDPEVPCFFIFGDSLADNGNNNKLRTLAKANYSPYGVDFSDGRPTGRFTNGRTTVDILGELLGFEKPIQSFESSFAFPELMRRGVNYASGAAGILRETGKHMGDNLSLGRQVRRHRLIKSVIADKMRLKKCLYWIGMGNNDYINNYFLPEIYETSDEFNPEQYAELLIAKYRQQVLKLYKYGARMVALDGLGQIGCTPNSIISRGTNETGCVETMNLAVQFFNEKLAELVDNLNSRFEDAKFVYINSTGSGSGDSTLAGFKVWDVGCCEVNEIGQCVEFQTRTCENRSEYVFWDSFHPTEASNLVTANRIYKMEISSLVNMFGHTNSEVADSDATYYD